MRVVVASFLVLALGFSPHPVAAQGQGQETASPGPAPGTPAGPAGQAGPAASGDVAKAPPPVRDVGGYAYDDKPGKTTARRALVRRPAAPSGPLVNLPGFEQLADGGSRLFVQLTQNVAVEERKAQGTITYVLKGAHARVHNNTNALVTVHFNTPVSRARLVPQGNDLHFVIELRAQATPTWKMSDAQDKTSTLTIDFPKGDYGGGDNAHPPPAAAPRSGKGPKKVGAKADESAVPSGPNP